MNKTEIKITIFGEEHDPSKEIEIYAPKDDEDKEDMSLKDYTQIIDTPCGLSALIIYRWSEDYLENDYDIMHNCREIHYLHIEGGCAFEGWGCGRDVLFLEKGDTHSRVKEIIIIKSPQWFEEDDWGYAKQNYKTYHCENIGSTLDEAVHPTWTGPLPKYAAKTITS